MLKTLLIIVLVSGSCLFFAGSPFTDISKKDKASYRQPNPRVLGVSEAAGFRTEKFSSAVQGHLPPTEEVDLVLPPTKKGDSQELELSANCGALIDFDSGAVLFGKEIDKVAPIASITKVMTALVFLENNPGWDKIYTVQDSDIVSQGNRFLMAGDKISNLNLLNISLIGSGNTAARSLANASGLEHNQFIERMNELATELGLKNTSFRDEIGFSAHNQSTAREVAKLLRIALGKEKIKEVVEKEKYICQTVQGRTINVRTTNRLLGPANDSILSKGGKTGYTDLAGGCFVGEFEDQKNHSIISVVLGSSNSYDRFSETQKMVNWAYETYDWPQMN